MNTNETRVQNSIPFPSHVTEPCPNTDVQAIARDLVNTSIDTNNFFESAGNVHKFVRTHFVDVETGVYGIERLIADILKSHNAVFPAGVETTEFKGVAIASSMFASEVIAEVQARFGKERYPYATIHSYLSYLMSKPNCKNKVGKIKLTGAEDSGRKCNKPRTKFYLVETK